MFGHCPCIPLLSTTLLASSIIAHDSRDQGDRANQPHRQLIVELGNLAVHMRERGAVRSLHGI